VSICRVPSPEFSQAPENTHHAHQCRFAVRSLSLTSSASRLVITPHLSPPDLPRGHDYTLEPGHPTPGWANLLRPHIALAIGTGIFTCFPSATHLCLALGADSPYADERCVGNLALTARGLFTPFNATHVSIRTSDTSSILLKTPSQAYRTLSYHAPCGASAASVTGLSPVTSSAQDDSISELLRFL